MTPRAGRLITTVAAMDILTAGADIGTMLGGVSIATAAVVWVRKQWSAWREQKDATHDRNWRGYLDPIGINTWTVRLVEEPETPTSQVVLEVVRDDGEPDVNWAQNLRQHIVEDGKLARIPSVAEFDYLKAQYKEFGYGKGIRIR